MYGTLRSRILGLVGFAVLITAVSIFFFAQREMSQVVTSSEEQHARDLLHAVELSVEAEYESLLFHRQATLERRKTELKNIVSLAMTHLDEEYQQYLAGRQSLRQSQQEAKIAIRDLRYDNGVGYLWINDVGRPYPHMVMHPTLPQLDGRPLDDPMFNTAMGSNKNLFVAMVDSCLFQGDGYVDYLWPKPTRQGLTEQQPKISYVKLFEPWQWVVGTGVYIDDIEAETERRRNAIIEELKDIFVRVRIAQSGYMFMFNGQGEMLVHPNLAGSRFASLQDPASGEPLYKEFIEVAKTTDNVLDYEWDKPGFEGEYRFPKRAFIVHFEPLDWYIGASLYTEELALPGEQLQQRVFVLALLSLLVAFLIAIGLSRSLSKPLWRLAAAAKKIEQHGLAAAEIPLSGTAETRELGQVLEQMVDSLGKAEEDRLNLEKQVLHVQKLESLGVLAGGIAHDFNNILLAISGNAEMGLRRVNQQKSPEKHLQRIRDAAEKAADLSRQMLAYSGKGTFQIERVDLNLLLEEMLQMLDISIAKNVTLNLDLTRPLPLVEVDVTQIRQVVLNLVVNASEAIGDTNGEINISTSSACCETLELKADGTEGCCNRGTCVSLVIADTGCGMDKETLERLYDPFFTTKFTGRGLGMSAVQGIVRGHKGAIKVSSELGKGSVFKVYLPVAEGEREASETELVAADDGWQGQGCVLLVDDEATVREIGSEILAELGYTVLTATDGRDALKVYQANPDIDFLILDLTMPHMGGEKCLRELQQLNPDVRVIMSSGYTELDNLQPLLKQGRVGLVQKPYSINGLKQTIRTFLTATVKTDPG